MVKNEIPPDGWACFDAFGAYVQGTFAQTESLTRALGCFQMMMLNDSFHYAMPEPTARTIDDGKPYKWMVRPVWLSTDVLLWRDRK